MKSYCSFSNSLKMRPSIYFNTILSAYMFNALKRNTTKERGRAISRTIIMSGAKYKGVLIELMSYLNKTTYPRGYQYSCDDLSNLTPSDLMRWMNKKVYGVEKAFSRFKTKGKNRNNWFLEKANFIIHAK